MKFLLAILGCVALSLGRAAAADAVPNDLVIEAWVDGGASLHLSPEGIYWTTGPAHKPGRWGSLDEPTYVNGVAWKPVWGTNKESGPDKSELYPIKWGPVQVNYHLIAVGQERGKTGKEKRTPVQAKMEGEEFVVFIPDFETGARWYKFSLKKR